MLPNDPENYYRQRDILPSDMLDSLGQAKIVITNFHAFQPREKVAAGKLTKRSSTEAQPAPSPKRPTRWSAASAAIWATRRTSSSSTTRPTTATAASPTREEEKLSGEERQEAKKREEEARVWISGLEAVKKKIGVKAIYDLSATPFFLRGSGYPEGTLFPWVVSDFSLIDAIESGIVKVPRVPVADNSMTAISRPTATCGSAFATTCRRRDARRRPSAASRSCLPNCRARCTASTATTTKSTDAGEQNADAQARGLTPPVFIVVCNNTNVSKLVFDYIAGWEKQIGEREAWSWPAQLHVFRNDDGRGGWLHAAEHDPRR